MKEKLTVDGEAIDLEAFDSSVWGGRNGHRLCAVHTESLAGDPFGRRHRAACGAAACGLTVAGTEA